VAERRGVRTRLWRFIWVERRIWAANDDGDTLGVAVLARSRTRGAKSRYAPDSQEPAFVEGPTYGTLTRWTGVLRFLLVFLVPLSMWPAIERDWQIDNRGIIGMGIVFVILLWIGVLGLASNFAKTRVFYDAIEWGFFRRRSIDFRRIDHVRSVAGSGKMCILHLVYDGGRTAKVPAASEPLFARFLQLAVRYGLPASRK
jgi:hypothetical protein